MKIVESKFKDLFLPEKFKINEETVFALTSGNVSDFKIYQWVMQVRPRPPSIVKPGRTIYGEFSVGTIGDFSTGIDRG